MSTRRETASYVLEQLEPLDVRVRPMFGEFCLYCDEKPVALICDDTVFLKPSAASDGLGLKEAEAYPGSKPYRIVGADMIHGSDAFRELVQATAEALPSPKPRKPRARSPR